MAEQSFEAYRPLLFSIAYRMLGSAMDAEDLVQEAWMRYQRVDPKEVVSPKAYLSTIITRLCINQLTSARAQREIYIGPWLPEPILTDDSSLPNSPASHLNFYDSISMAFLTLLERLTPAERAVFLLREVFDYRYSEIAEMIGKSEAACRQLFSRAKRQMTVDRPRFEHSPATHERLVNGFLRAVESGDVVSLTQLLAEDVVVWTDGGGKVFALLQPVYGREKALRFLLAARELVSGPYAAEVTAVNGRAAVILRAADDKAFLVIGMETDQEQIHTFHIIGNPDKLRHL